FRMVPRAPAAIPASGSMRRAERRARLLEIGCLPFSFPLLAALPAIMPARSSSVRLRSIFQRLPQNRLAPLTLTFQLLFERHRIAGKHETETHAPSPRSRRVVEPVRLHQPARVPAFRHVAKPALVYETIVDERVDHAIDK